MNKEKLVTVIIPTYNRFDYLLKAIQSVRNQNYKNIEIIIVNDCSSELEYYNYKFENCIVINLDKNSKKDLDMLHRVVIKEVRE